MPDYYNDQSTVSEPPTEAATEKEDTGDSTALLPKNFLGGGSKQPGDRCEVEVVRVLDDQVEVKYVEHDAEESAEAAPAAPEMSAPPSPGGNDAYA